MTERNMTTVLLIQNCEVETLGVYERAVTLRAADVVVTHPYRGEPLPPLDGIAAIVIGGTPVSAYDAERVAFMRAELEYLHAAVAAGKPCLGVCCGAQMLARVLGANVGPCPEKEIGSYRVRRTSAGRDDPLLDGFPTEFPVFHWHGDTFDLPVGAELLVEGNECRNQMSRRGPVVGVQFHLEVTPDEAARWAGTYADELAASGHELADVEAGCVTDFREMERLADVLIENFLHEVVGVPPSPIDAALAFVRAINGGDPDVLAGQMAEEHRFMDSDGNEYGPRDEMRDGWVRYYAMVPDFRIEVRETLSRGNTVALFGVASGTFAAEGQDRSTVDPQNAWSVPAAWRVVVDDDLVAVWQLYVNPEPMREIIERMRAE